MFEPVTDLYCSQQIHVPPRFPFVLKTYAKAAIRTQPYDLLRWSAGYFRALAEGTPVPAKTRIEIPPTVNACGLTPGFLRILLHQYGMVKTVPREVLYHRWVGITLCEVEFRKMLTVARLHLRENVPWLEFFAVMVGHLNSSLTLTMIMICELLTEEPDGGSAMIPFGRFIQMYHFLARMDCSKPQRFKGGRRLLTRTNKCGDLVEYLDEVDDAILEPPPPVIEQEEEQDEQEEEGQPEISEPILKTDTKPSKTEGKKTVHHKHKALPFYGGEKMTTDCIDKGYNKEQISEDLKIMESLASIPSPVDEPGYHTLAEAEGAEEEDSEHNQLVERRKGAKEQAVLQGKVRRPTIISDDLPDQLVQITEPAMGTSPPAIDDAEAEPEEKLEEEAKSSTKSKDSLEEEEGGGDDKPEIQEEAQSEKTSVKSEEAESEKTSAESRHASAEVGSDEEKVENAEEILPRDHEELDEVETPQEQEQEGEHDEHLAEESWGAIDAIGEEAIGENEAGYEEIIMEEMSEFGEEEKKDSIKFEEDYDMMIRGDQDEILEIPEIRGIGERVPDHIVDAATTYLRKLSRKQHGMVMPRNIRHYLCPPLERLVTFEESTLGTTSIIF